MKVHFISIWSMRIFYGQHNSRQDLMFWGEIDSLFTPEPEIDLEFNIMEFVLVTMLVEA